MNLFVTPSIINILLLSLYWILEFSSLNCFDYCALNDETVIQLSEKNGRALIVLCEPLSSLFSTSGVFPRRRTAKSCCGGQ